MTANSDNKSKRKIKIIHILSRLETGGLENGTVNICNKLNIDLFEPSICCLKGLGPMTNRLKSDIKVFNLSFQEGKMPLRPLKMAMFFKREKPDIVHTHGWGQCSFDGIIGARLASVPIVINGEHGSFYLKKYQIFLQRVLARLCDLTLSVSESLKEKIIDNLGIPLSMIYVIPNGVDTNIFNGNYDTAALKCEIFERFNVDVDSSFLIVSIGSLKTQKNQKFLLHTVKEINERRHDNNIKVIFVGNGPDYQMLEQYARKNLKIGQVIFLGERNDIPLVLSFASLLVSTSLSRYEGLSNVILEAMSSGIPVIATKSVGTEELVKEGFNGFIIDPSDKEGLIRKIELFANDALLWKKMSKNCKKFTFEKFSIIKMVSLYENIYLNIFNNKKIKLQ